MLAGVAPVASTFRVAVPDDGGVAQGLGRRAIELGRDDRRRSSVRLNCRARRRRGRGDGPRGDDVVEHDVADRRPRAVELDRRRVGERRRAPTRRTARTCPRFRRPIRLRRPRLRVPCGSTLPSFPPYSAAPSRPWVPRPPRSPEPAASPARLVPVGHHDASRAFACNTSYARYGVATTSASSRLTISCRTRYPPLTCENVNGRAKRGLTGW